MNLQIDNLEQLSDLIQQTQQFFLSKVQQQVNVALTLRNWLIGHYIVEYEQNGKDRAEYGKTIIKTLSEQLKQKKLKGFSEIALRLNRTFYFTYPQIQQTLSVELQKANNQLVIIQQTLSVESLSNKNTEQKANEIEPTNPYLLINRLSFSHFIEFLKVDDLLKRTFYEIETLKNNWTVRQLHSAMNNMLFERTGFSVDKKNLLLKQIKNQKIEAKDVFRNPLILDFLEFEEKREYSENDLETAIINHLQRFLIELGNGFCFEARQKRITFDNTHYRIDLVFYHRILKCHVLIDLKLGEFTHADSGQMNVYLNYYKEYEMQEGDNLPIGIILCASKNESLVKFATAGLPQQVFVSKYLLKLPNEQELKKIIEEEQAKL